VAAWQRHLDGIVGFGAFALTDEGTCRWGAIDIDVYRGFDARALQELVRGHELPLTMCRTKSGGWHLYLFLAEFAPAKLVRDKLRNWAAALGHPKAERFPKHDAMQVAVGNFLNMPYFGGERSVRYAIGADGKSLSVDEFLDRAEASRITAEQLEAWPTLAPKARAPKAGLEIEIDPSTPVIDDDFEGEATGFENVSDDELRPEGKGDEFWQKIADGLGPTKRHNGIKVLAGLLFGYLEPHLADVLVRLFAEHQCEPPLRGQELDDIIKWVAKRELGG
jgi:hypothetical protein